MGSDIEHQRIHDEVRVIAEFGDIEGGTSYVEHGMAREIMRLRRYLEQADAASKILREVMEEMRQRVADTEVDG